MNYQLSEVFNLFGGFLGIILTIVVLSLMNGRRVVKISSAGLLLVASLIVIIGSMLYSGKIAQFPFLIRADSPIHYLLGPSLYFYCIAVIKPDFRFRAFHLIHLIPFVINFIEFVPFYFSANADKLSYYQGFLDSGTVIIRIHYLLKTISVTAYFIAQIFLIFRNRSYLQGKRRFFLWVIIFLAGQLLMIMGGVLDHLSGLTMSLDPYRFAMNMVTLFLYSFAITILFFPRILYGNFDDVAESKVKYQRSGLTEAEKDKILELWENYVSGPDKPYLSHGLNLNMVSDILKVKAQQLSQVINEKSGLNFNEYVNRNRVEEAKKLLLAEENKNLTIEAIARKAGFNSKGSFYAAFKRFTGLTPKTFFDKLSA
jgi:AraC-like DNA-binding protein